MSIKSKTLTIVLSVLTATVLLITISSQLLILRGFGKIETDEMTKNVKRGLDTVQYDLEQADRKGTDWSYWSATYEFMSDHNQDYIDENLIPLSTIGASYNFMLYYDLKGKLIASLSYDVDTSQPIDLPKGLLSSLGPNSPFLTNTDEAGKRGILTLPEGIIMVASRPILNGEAPELPKAGTFIYAYYLNETRTKTMSSISHLPLKFYSYTSDDLPADVKSFKDKGQNDSIIITPQNGKTVTGYAVIKDTTGSPAAIVQVEQPRSFVQQGQRTLIYLIGAILASGVLLATVLSILLSRYVSGPISKLAQEVANIHGGDNKTARVTQPQRYDDVGKLARGINGMLLSLSQARQAIVHEKTLVEQKVVERTRELAEAQAELASSVRNLPFGFMLINKRGDITFVNAMLQKIVGFTPHSTSTNSDILEHITSTYASSFNLNKRIQKALSGKKSIETTIEHNRQHLRFIFTPVISQDKNQQEEILGVVIVVEDITQQKMLERTRDEFFSIASHELRTPLTAIRGNASMLLTLPREEMQATEVHEMIEDVHKASVRLISIVNAFLDTSRLELGRIEFKKAPIDVTELLHNIVHEYATPQHERGISLTFQEPAEQLPVIQADPDRLRQILINLLGNAINATDSGSITFTAAVKEKSLYITLTDTGKGIAEEVRPLLFRKFQQASDSILTRDNSHSTGLGLYISNLLAEGMRGKLYLEHSVPNEGSAFTLKLPLA